MSEKLIIIICALLTWNFSFGQKRDYRGQLIPDGRVTELSISPDEKLWIGTYLGGLYYTDSFDSIWKTCNSPKLFSFSNDDEYANKPNIDRISFFNSQQAIMTGYISLEKWGDENGIYQTSDGGKTWSSIDFGGDMWVYDAFVNNNGNAWIGGSSGKLHYSDDYGTSWTVCNSPNNLSIRIKSIFMVDSLQGILGTTGHYGNSTENYLYSTNDNWKTSTPVETPYSQGKIDSDGKGLDVDEVYIWNDYYIVKQGKDYFFSNKLEPNWIKLQDDLQTISIDKESKRIYAITDSLQIIEIKDFENYVTISDEFVKRKPKTFKSVNDCIYILDEDNEVYKISHNQTKSTLLYSNEIQISPPVIQDSFADTKAGVEGKQILLFDNQQNKWYRIGAVDFYMHDFYLKNNTEAILWSGNNSYLYNLSNNKMEIFKYEKPLNEFLLYNIAEIIINCGRSCGYGGCHGVRFDQIVYEQKDSLLLCDRYKVFSVGELGANRKEKKKKYKSSFKEANLSVILNGVNENPYKIPTFSDFAINGVDKVYNTEKVKQINSESDKSEFEKTILNLDIYLNETVDKIIEQNESVLWSTCNEWFGVTIINENADTLTFTKQYYADSKAYHFPWTVNYKKMYFTSYNLDFSKKINAILPEKFRGKEYFDNNVLLIELNDYRNQ
jgi:photosystem II stability/assembly factor-like uncharacterized protein